MYVLVLVMTAKAMYYTRLLLEQENYKHKMTKLEITCSYVIENDDGIARGVS